MSGGTTDGGGGNGHHHPCSFMDSTPKQAYVLTTFVVVVFCLGLCW